MNWFLKEHVEQRLPPPDVYRVLTVAVINWEKVIVLFPGFLPLLQLPHLPGDGNSGLWS